MWEITLACDLACRHCGSRAGHARPDELSTAECLDLVNQMADLGVQEVTIIGGEAYLREDWLEILAAIRARGMQATMTTGGRGLTPERARAAAEAGLQSTSVSIDGNEETHDRLRGVPGSYRSALEALKNLSGAGVRVSTNTQINRLSIPELPQVLEAVAAAGVHSWQLQLTVAMGRAADEPDVLLQPYDLLELFPLLAELKARADELGVRIWPGNNIGYFGPYESVLRGTMPQGHMGSCGAGRSTLGIEADGAIKGCPSLQTGAWTGGNIRDASLQGHLGARRAAALHAQPHRGRPVGLLPHLLLRRRVPRRLHLDRVLAVRPRRQQPVLPPPRAGDAAARQTRTTGAESVCTRRALRPRRLRSDRGRHTQRGGDAMSHLVPCPECDRHVRTRESECPFCGAALELSATPPRAMPRGPAGARGLVRLRRRHCRRNDGRLRLGRQQRQRRRRGHGRHLGLRRQQWLFGRRRHGRHVG